MKRWFKSQTPKESQVEALENFFGKANLAVPIIATHLEDLIFECRNWHWATQESPLPIDDYSFFDAIEYLKGSISDQYSVCHAGHGINSYSLNFRHASGDLAMIAQAGWGGAYDDIEQDTKCWNEMVLRVNSILALTAIPSAEESTRKYILTASNFRLPSEIQFWIRTDNAWELSIEITTWDSAYDFFNK